MTHNNDCPHFAGGSARMRTFQDPRVSQHKLLRLQNATSNPRAFTKLPAVPRPSCTSTFAGWGAGLRRTRNYFELK
jgi:hypothetical protein